MPSTQEGSNTELTVLDSLPQGFLSSDRKSPPVAIKIADLIVLSGNLSADMAKEHSESICRQKIVAVTKLGFLVHPDKSVFQPTQIIEFLGFIINSITMFVSLTLTKAARVHKACQDLLNNKHITIREVAHVIGLLVSSLPAVQY